MLGTNKLKKMLLEGKKPVGTYVKTYDPAITEVCSLVGYDCIISITSTLL